YALGRIADNDVTRVEIARDGGIPPLVALVRAGTDGQKQWAVYALCHLSANNEGNCSSIAQKQWATFALRHLAVNKEVNRVMVKEYGDVERLLDGSKSSGNLRRIFSPWRRWLGKALPSFAKAVSSP
ncbi:hypothetical protein BBJ28_00026071, partial [Nothophytophthora sp. Chile5]